MHPGLHFQNALRKPHHEKTIKGLVQDCGNSIAYALSRLTGVTAVMHKAIDMIVVSIIAYNTKLCAIDWRICRIMYVLKWQTVYALKRVLF